jgi:hypothetical protein
MTKMTAKLVVAFATRDEWKARIHAALQPAIIHAFKIAVGEANNYLTYRTYWRGELTTFERILIRTARKDKTHTRSAFNRVKAADEVIGSMQQDHRGYWQDAVAAIADHLEKPPKEIRLPSEQEQRDVENAFWLRMHTAIEDAVAGRTPE